MPDQFFGKYRGTVVDNVDPLQLARLRVSVPAVSVDGTPWAMPCLPLAGPQSGVFVLPGPGAGVWVEFEQGDPSSPIWTGCWYGSAAEVPPLALTGPPQSPNILLQTQGQNLLVLSDAPGSGITVRSASGAVIVVDENQILISNGQGASIRLAGPTVDLNAGALTVT